MYGRFARVRVVLLCIMAVAGVASAGCAAGGSRTVPIASQSLVPAGTAQVELVAAATPTPVPPPIQTDADPSTAGVFLGEVCGPGTIVPCIDFGQAYRKSPALATVFADW